jgi:serine/threonine protein kinase
MLTDAASAVAIASNTAASTTFSAVGATVAVSATGAGLSAVSLVPATEPNAVQTASSALPMKRRRTLDDEQIHEHHQHHYQHPSVQHRAPRHHHPVNNNDLAALGLPPVDSHLDRRVFPYHRSLESEYELLERIGEGTFSSVFRARRRDAADADADTDADIVRVANVASTSIAAATAAAAASAAAATTSAASTTADDLAAYVAVKRVYSTSSPARIENEIAHLVKLNGEHGVVKLLQVYRQDNDVALVMPLFDFVPFKEYLPYMDVAQIAHYMRGLLTAVEHIHRHGIMHRDVKPSNFLRSRDGKRYLLIDFGLAQVCPPVTNEPTLKSGDASSAAAANVALANGTTSTAAAAAAAAATATAATTAAASTANGVAATTVSATASTSATTAAAAAAAAAAASAGSANITSRTRRSLLAPSSRRMMVKQQQQQQLLQQQQQQQQLRPQKQVAARGGTRGFRAPEVLWRFELQTTAIDLWSVGVVMLSMLTCAYPFFHAPDDLAALGELTVLLGTARLTEAAKKCHKSLFDVPPVEPGVSFKTLVCAMAPARYEVLPDEAYALLAALLDPCYVTRITASAALEHPFIRKFSTALRY